MIRARPFTGRPARWGLKGKLILSMLLVGVVPLFAGLLMAFLQGSREIREVSGESFKALATETARKLDLVVGEEIGRTSHIAIDPVIVAELEKRRDRIEALSEAQAQAALAAQASRWQARDPALIKEITDNTLAQLLRQYYTGSNGEPGQPPPQAVRSATKALFLTDKMGALVASLNSDIPYAHGGTAWWQGAFNKGIGSMYIEDVAFDDRVGSYVFTLSVPVMDSIRYEAIGVLHRIVDAKEFFSPSIAPIRFGRTGHVMLIDSRGVVMSCPILSTGARLADADLVSLVTPLEPGWVNAPSDGHGGRTPSIIGFAPLPETSRATNGSSDTAWHTFVWQSSSELFAPIRHLFTWLSVFGLIAVGLLIMLGSFAAGRIVTPIRQLQEAARAIGRGELRDRLTIRTGDELEELAEEINRMNAQLEAAFAGLTSQVELKSQEVQYLQQSTDQILDAMPTPIIMVDQAEQVQYLNRACKDAFKLEADDAPRPLMLFDLLRVNPSVQQQLRQELLRAGNGALQKTGAADTSPLPARDPLDPAPAHAVRGGRRELQLGRHLYRYEWFSLGGRPGEGRRIGLVLRDATEESRLQDQLIQAEKSGSLGMLTAGIGHELNNPLFGILGLGEAIQEETDLGRIKSYARDIVEHGRRMAAVIRDFAGQAFREAKDQRAPVDVNAQLDQAWAIVQSGFETLGIEMQTYYQPHLRVSALPDELRQAFVNVLVNAVQAMRGKGSLVLRTERDASAVTIMIRDTGPGIPPEHLTKVFDPFFTTKPQGEGSGLGLTIAKRIIVKFGGDIRLESAEGQGVTCWITFPTIAASHKEDQMP
ncbi:MAG TPA: ATP-binding protein [Nitrospiraceae bacterium]|jgi:signal transduction histidine kinase|nr:ATP-binding protein [Nitrospiraceae bacterium]